MSDSGPGAGREPRTERPAAGAAGPARRPADGRALVLGGTGFIGRHVAEAFLAAAWDVTVAARRPGEIAGKLPLRTVAVDLSEVGVADLAQILAAERPAVVVNAAGGGWNATEAGMRASNVSATEHLLTALSLIGHRPRLVQIGTVMEYGPAEVGASVSERSACSPLGAYGRTKLAASRAVLAACAARRVDATLLRVANVSGPGTPRASLLGKVADSLVTAVRAGQPTIIELAPLRARRDYVDVRDVADAVLAAATVGTSGQVINIGRGEAVAVRALVDLLISVSGVRAQVIERASGQGQSASTASGADWLQVDITAAGQLLGWRPRRSLRESLTDHWAHIAAISDRPALPSAPTGARLR
jgi:nucleoside-diphosphate-sugar epimerase